MTKNDDAWEDLFEKYNILNEIEKNGKYEISSSQINKVRPARLMAKFDYEHQLPPIFSENELSILPITRGRYVISKFEAYHNLKKESKEIINFPFPDHIQSIKFNNITSETHALNCAFITGILEDFLEDEDVVPTVGGRMGSGKFDFNIWNNSKSAILDVSINNCQIEIDGAYEGVNFLSLIEAKIDIPENFLVRQLYYPLRAWKDNVTKKVKTIFLVYSNGIFSLYEYAFGDEYCYNSLKLTKQQDYSIIDGEIEIEDIESIVNSVEIIPEPEIPFPQADKFERLISLCESLKENKLTKDEITEKYSFDMRQSDYYASAGIYLGLIGKTYVNGRTPCYSLTDKGNELFNLPLKQRQLELVECILEHEVFLKIFKLWLENGEEPSTNDCVNIMDEIGIYNVNSEDTLKRRARTVLRWLEWILELKNIG
jgi:hypothetical protein